ncbi:hypothetical protein N7452_007876 [Penicillium brevicompactum]|uniref:HNH nuclease domain-containing protein n=1 Tax=Penicillium brevicompactum TaxID=5074 RepID=A0A9W9UG60_PENBR|nr:hypothetical protein N7452_007876 [Penicillium brevicompactum]
MIREYGAQWPGYDHLWCPVLGDWRNNRSVVAAHLFGYMHGQATMDAIFGKRKHLQLFSPQNGILVSAYIEDYLDSGKLIIVPDLEDRPKLTDLICWLKSPVRNLKMRVLDPNWSKMDTQISRDLPLKYKDLDNRRLIFKTDFRPAARYLKKHKYFLRSQDRSHSKTPSLTTNSTLSSSNSALISPVDSESLNQLLCSNPKQGAIASIASMQETEELERIPANLQQAGYSPVWTSVLGYPGEIPEGIKEFICPEIEQGNYLVGQLSSIFWLKSVEFLNELIRDPGHKLQDDLYLIQLADGRRWFFIVEVLFDQGMIPLRYMNRISFEIESFDEALSEFPIGYNFMVGPRPSPSLDCGQGR